MHHVAYPKGLKCIKRRQRCLSEKVTEKGNVLLWIYSVGHREIEYDEDDEKAEVPGQQRSQEDHPLLPPQISIALEEVEGQEENNYHHDSQRSATHLDE
ncbi:hypothetical protein EYF80_009150 [Liparis tanakae]|uniref:Uncharacterized protein n=1 Tax=Liparis tanakae TaxID=230148 RepID=A0A4Z2ITL0_9TELE|nr:hypothetical protein EYF80_009150 [Liparis tanakae]